MKSVIDQNRLDDPNNKSIEEASAIGSILSSEEGSDGD